MAIELSEKQIKDGWQIVKFGEIAKNISKRVEPSETDLEVYVGLEHLDPQSLRITRRGVPADVKGQKLRVRPGQIIFGKRRAYQKKVAVADFEGICSAHAMVLEEVVGKIIPGLLPFFMQSDMFMDRAVAISEGSLSPTIKWKTLAIQEFPLPPIERQKEILEVLEKANEQSEKCNAALLAAQKGLFKVREEIFGIRSESFSEINLSELADCKGGYGFKRKYQGKKKGDYPFIKVSDMNLENNTKYISQSENWISEDDLKIMRVSPFSAGVVVFAKVGAALLLNRRRILKRPTVIDNNMMAAIPNAKIKTAFLYHYLNTVDFADFARNGALPSVNQSDVGSLKIKLPPLELQEEWSSTLDMMENAIDTLIARKNVSVVLGQRIFDELMLGGAQ